MERCHLYNNNCSWKKLCFYGNLRLCSDDEQIHKKIVQMNKDLVKWIPLFQCKSEPSLCPNFLFNTLAVVLFFFVSLSISSHTPSRRSWIPVNENCSEQLYLPVLLTEYVNGIWQSVRLNCRTESTPSNAIHFNYYSCNKCSNKEIYQ